MDEEHIIMKRENLSHFSLNVCIQKRQIIFTELNIFVLFVMSVNMKGHIPHPVSGAWEKEILNA